MCVWQDEMAISLLCICISPGRTCTHGRLDGRPTPTTACGLHTGKRAGRETIDRVFAVPELDGYLRFSCLSFVPSSDSICLQHTRARALLLTRSIVRRRRPGHMGGRGALARAVTDRYPSASRYHAGGGGAGGVAPPLRSRGPAGRGRDIRRAVGHAACAQGRGNYVCVSRTIWQTRPPDMHAWCTGATRDYGKKGKERPCMYVLLYTRDVATDTFFLSSLLHSLYLICSRSDGTRTYVTFPRQKLN